MTSEVATVVGTGLIGGSIGLALARKRWTVRGFDPDAERLERSVAVGAVHEAAPSLAAAVDGAGIVFVAAPVGAIPGVVIDVLDASDAVVTDVGSVKSPVVDAVHRQRPDRGRRFVGGHPMAGSEQDGIEGADADLFSGATWVLTPTEHTDAAAFATVRGTVASLGADLIAVTPEHHDELVAYVSHVPQLAATTLMDVADRRESEHRALLRLAAGGFRDMTRIAAGHPGIWPDIVSANRDAVLRALDSYLAALQRIRGVVEAGDRDALLAVMERARAARRNLPVGVRPEVPLVEFRVRVPDREGVLAEITTAAGELGINIADMEVAHSLEGGAGVIVLVIPAAHAEALDTRLRTLGYHGSWTAIP
jgi:prephenate dehydrogenase